MQIAELSIGVEKPPFVIAEMSGNHNHSLERALSIVDAAADAGAHAIKLQTYTADTITLDVDDGDFWVSNEDLPWKNISLYDLYQKAFTPWEWHEDIFRRAKEHGLVCFSTPFDETAVDFLKEIGAPAYKIASFENSHLPLIKKVASTGKPVIISSGMATVSELAETVSTAREHGCVDLALLKCTSSYPSKPIDSNILTIPHMRDLFNCEIGLSDHTLGVGVAVASIALGATIIEKHFTLSRAEGGVDSAFSLEPDEFKTLVTETARAHESLGRINYGSTASEQSSKVFRRSLYISQNMKAGDVLTKDNMRIVRPGFGLHPRYYEKLLGRKVNQTANKGSPLTWEIIG